MRENDTLTVEGPPGSSTGERSLSWQTQEKIVAATILTATYARIVVPLECFHAHVPQIKIIPMKCVHDMFKCKKKATQKQTD